MPDWKAAIRQQLTPLQLAPTRENAIVEELAQDLDDCYAALLAGGASEAEAYQQTLTELHDSEWLSRELRRAEKKIDQEPILLGTNRRKTMMADFVQDLRYGVRMLMKHPGFSFIAILTLALSIGANTAIFSLINALFLRPLPVKSPHELVGVFSLENANWANGVSYPDFLYLRERNTVLTGLAAYHVIDLADADAREIVGCVVSSNYFSLLGVQPILGRSFLTAEDEVPGRNPVAVLSYEYWQRQFAGEPSIVGKTVRLNGTTFTVIGIAPSGFDGAQSELTPVAVWIPVMMTGEALHRDDTWGRSSFRLYKMIGRLQPGQTSASAETELQMLASQLEAAYPETNKGRGIRLAPASHIHPGDYQERARLPWVLMAAVSCLLLTACVNLAGLLLARGLHRQKEIAVRLSLGASRGRILRQLLTESLVLSCCGGIASLPAAVWTTTLLNSFYAEEIRGTGAALNLSLDATVLGYAVMLSVLAAVAAGLVPALRVSRTNFYTALRTAGAAQGGQHTRLRAGLLVTQIALSLVLLISASLLLHSLNNVLLKADFEAEQVVAFRVKPHLVGYSSEQVQQYYHEAARRLAAVPGVQSLTFAGAPGPIRDGVTLQLPEQALAMRVPTHHITPRYFETLRIPLVLGRDFNERDGPDNQRVVIVNEALAYRLWPKQTAIGQRIQLDEKEYEVIGVAKYSNYSNHLDTPRDLLFLPAAQPGNRFLVRVTGDVQAMLPVIRKTINGIDPAVPITEELPLTEVVKRAFRSVRLAGSILSAAGVLAMLLSAIGLYGVLAFAVSQRTQEIGIRLALGATPHSVVRLVLAQGMKLALLGIVLGLAIAFVVTRSLQGFLYGVGATDPLIFAAVVPLFSGVALLACCLPARKAMKVNPIIALRNE